MVGAAQQANPVAQCAVEQHGHPIRQQQHHRHHHRGLGNEGQAGKPQLDAVPPVEEAAHPARVFEPASAVVSGSVVASAEAEVLDVINRLIQELGDMAVVIGRRP
jgi:hypothetical protein